jgi:alpha/beta superfamily hydrolase
LSLVNKFKNIGLNMADVFFNGPAGRIEGKYNIAEKSNAPVVLILHPHPLYGGTMNNKIVHSLYKTFLNNGFSVLRINFRGVGKSQGEFDSGAGELMDATTALDWLQSQNHNSSQIWIAGFSFGAWIGMQLIMRRPEIVNFVSISPPVGKYDFSFLSPCPIPGLMIRGNKDSIISETAIEDLMNSLSKQKYIKVESHAIEGADHFFRDNVSDLEILVSSYIKNMNNKETTKVNKKQTKTSSKLLLVV